MLPLAVATTSLWINRGAVRRPNRGAAVAALAVFVALVALGYLVPWRWTGFSGNTAWDWVKLLLVPLLLPTVLQPAVVSTPRAPPGLALAHQRARLVPDRQGE